VIVKIWEANQFLRYYQPNPQAPAPFTPQTSLNDPTFSNCAGQTSNCYDAWGLRIVNSENVLVYGAGHYSFFNNYAASKFPNAVEN
jgi:glucan 1,3-beta-glucosidase